MVLLMEEFGGLSLKRKGADEPELFDRSGFPLSCRATKMRRLACPDAGHCRQDGPAASRVGAKGQVDLPVCDPAPVPVGSSAATKEKAMILYGGGGGAPFDAAQSAQRIWPCGADVCDVADWLRAILCEADSRTVRELLASAQEQGDDLALAVVPWMPPSSAEEAEPSEAAEALDDGDSDGAAAMDVDEEEDQVQHWTRQTTFGSAGAGCGEGFVYRWPQHCMAPQQLPVVGQAVRW